MLSKTEAHLLLNIQLRNSPQQSSTQYQLNKYKSQSQ